MYKTFRWSASDYGFLAKYAWLFGDLLGFSVLGVFL